MLGHRPSITPDPPRRTRVLHTRRKRPEHPQSDMRIRDLHELLTAIRAARVADVGRMEGERLTRVVARALRERHEGAPVRADRPVLTRADMQRRIDANHPRPDRQVR